MNGKRIALQTKRLKLHTASQEEMRRWIDAQTDDVLVSAYNEMLQGCLMHPEQWEWYAMWMIELENGAHVGELCFKGRGADGSVEIGYGISEAYRGCGYASEAVDAAVRWALRQPGIARVEAETEADNIASRRVLEKCGFLPSGITGEEGPRFERCGDHTSPTCSCLEFEEAVKTIPPGRYRHFKGKEYEVICIARHSETEEPMVVYKALYGDGGVWCRPAAMWNEQVTRNGVTYRRFYRLDRIERVEKYERLFEEATASPDPETLRALDAYYTSGEWLEDYEADERGELPPTLKRGVLSQDALYDLLERASDEK